MVWVELTLNKRRRKQNRNYRGAGEMAQLMKRLAHKHESLSSHSQNACKRTVCSRMAVTPLLRWQR